MTLATPIRLLSATLLLALAGAFSACSDGDGGGGAGGTEADRHGIGAECVTADDCAQPTTDAEPAQLCLSFKGGYCGSTGCTLDTDCPDGAACVAHDDGTNYCFRVCGDKSECNRNRTPDNEANCSSSITFTDPNTLAQKACVPPSSS